MIDIFVDYPGTWYVIETTAGKTIGRICDKESTVEYWAFSPAFNYVSELVETNEGIARQVMVTPYDLCVSFNSTLHINRNNIIRYMPFRDMDVSDRREYEKVVNKGVDIALKSRASKSGISLETSLPKDLSNNPFIFNR